MDKIRHAALVEYAKMTGISSTATAARFLISEGLKDKGLL